MDGIKEQCFSVGVTSKIEIVKGAVKKIIIKSKETDAYNLFLGDFYKNNPVLEHEVRVLNRLKGCNIAPEILDVGKDYFVMTHVGSRLSEKISRSRVNEILYVMSCFQVKHNDVRYRNICEKEGKVFLIDWQMASIDDIIISKQLRKYFNQKELKDREELLSLC